MVANPGNLRLLGVDVLDGHVVVPKNYAVKYAVRFVRDFVPGGVNPPPAAAPGKLDKKDEDFLWFVAMLPYNNNELFDNLLALKNDEQKLVETLDEMFDNFVIV